MKSRMTRAFLKFNHIRPLHLQYRDETKITNMQADRRRINAPGGGTSAPIFVFAGNEQLIQQSIRTRKLDEHRKIYLRTGIVPSASGSAYYEIPPQGPSERNDSLVPHSSSLKIMCTVHGPRPLPRNAAFSPNLLLSTHVKFAPFATEQRRGYVRDASEQDLGVHLDAALRGVIVGERWPKSACEVIVTVLEGEEDGWSCDRPGGMKSGGWGMMNVLAGCITAASAALVDAGVDCVDMVSGGVAAAVRVSGAQTQQIVLDPSPSEHEICAACVVGYLQSRDEITEMWLKGGDVTDPQALIDSAVKAATMTRTVLVEAVREAAEVKVSDSSQGPKETLNQGPEDGKRKDIVMVD